MTEHMSGDDPKDLMIVAVSMGGQEGQAVIQLSCDRELLALR